MLFRVAYLHNCDTLVLSAHGCGAWGGPVTGIATIFKEVIHEFDGCFKIIVFAILTNSKLCSDNTQSKSKFHIFKKILVG